jgi:hypothetical protein
MGAAMGGGIAALQGKDVLKGALMGGVGGALGGVLMPAAGGIAGATEGVAAGAVGEGVGATANALGNVGATELTNAGIMNAGGNLTPTGAAQFMGSDAGFQLANPAAAGSGGIGSFLSANKGALMGGVGGGMLAPGKEVDPAAKGNIYTTQFSQEKNPLFGQQGQDYFASQTYAPGTYTKVEDYNPTQMAANGGIIALAEGGKTDRYSRPMRTVDPAVAAYNAQLMEMANQQYNVNPRPGPNQVPGSTGYGAPMPNQAAAPAAPAGDSISGLRFNPVTQRFEGEFQAPDAKKRPVFDMSEESNAPYYNHSAGDGGGNANGGLMSSYAAGGISTLGSYSDGGQLLKGPGDGVSDDIPAQIGARQPARLADGEFVVPARIVSELGNGSTDAGAKRLYSMMDRVQNNRKKSIGKGKVAVDSKAHKMLPA